MVAGGRKTEYLTALGPAPLDVPCVLQPPLGGEESGFQF